VPNLKLLLLEYILCTVLVVFGVQVICDINSVVKSQALLKYKLHLLSIIHQSHTVRTFDLGSGKVEVVSSRGS